MSSTEAFRRGARLAVDVGEVRIGVARCDPDGILATPLRTVPRSDHDDGSATIAALAQEQEAIEIVVGLPCSLSGEEGRAAHAVRAYAKELALRCSPTEVRLVDERLTTVSAHQALQAAGRREKQHRSVVDQVAAALILEQALASERRTGKPPGEVLELRATDEEMES